MPKRKQVCVPGVAERSLVETRVIDIDCGRSFPITLGTSETLSFHSVNDANLALVPSKCKIHLTFRVTTASGGPVPPLRE